MTRFTALRLAPYGHFEDFQVDFGPGLTVVYGRNEAGKSTLLDAMADFLWGISAQNHPRAYLLKPKALLIQGTVVEDFDETSAVHDDGATVGQSGEGVTYTRRLKELRAGDESKVSVGWGDADDRRSWIFGFGFDHERLMEGGRRIVDGDDDPAGIEFLAETGIDLDAVREALQGRMDELFKDSGNAKNVLVRRLIASIAEIDRRLREEVASSREVTRLRDRKQLIEESLEQVHEEERRLRRLIDSCQEMLRCYANAAMLRDAESQAAEVRAGGTCLARAEASRLQNARARCDQAVDDARRHRKDIEGLEDRARKLEPDQGVLERAEVIDHLVTRVTAVRDAEIVARGSGADVARNEVCRCLAELGLVSDDPGADYADVVLSSDRVEQLDRAAEALEAARGAVHEQEARVADTRMAAREEPETHVSGAAEQVASARYARDEAWARVREPWISGDLPVPEARKALADRVDESIESADTASESAADDLTAIAEARGRRKQQEATLERDVAQLERLVAVAEREGQRWAALVADSGLRGGTDTQAWTVRSRHLKALESAWTEWQRQLVDVRAAKDRVERFYADTKPLEDLLDSPGWDHVANAERLRRVLEDARKADAQLVEVQAQLASSREKLKRALADEQEAKTVIAEVAGDGDDVELLRRSEELHRLQEEMASLRESVRGAKNPGTDLDELLAELGRCDDIELEQRAESLAPQLDAVRARHEELARELGGASRELLAVEERASVAELRAEREELVGQLRDAVDEYRSLAMQRAIVDAYLKDSATEAGTSILEMAGQYLERLTEGRYAGFAIETHRERRWLRIVAGNGELLTTRELSTGTEYQVYFALRLAGIASAQRKRVDMGRGTLPVVLDDVLLAYDDYRANAALELLGDISRSYQIVLLTHSRTVRDGATALDGVAVVDLPLRAPATA